MDWDTAERTITTGMQHFDCPAEVKQYEAWTFEHQRNGAVLVRVGKRDAGFFQLYGLARDEVGNVMETFPIVRRRNEAAHGGYPTKRLILERYTLAEATATCLPYESVLDPPPADPAVAHRALV